MKLNDCPGFHDAVNEACTCGGGGPPDCCPACEVYHAVKDWEVAGPVAQPRPPAPELGEAECRLRLLAEGNVNRFDVEEATVIAAEIGRLRAEVARLMARKVGP
jgi:hypothetical protein